MICFIDIYALAFSNAYSLKIRHICGQSVTYHCYTGIFIYSVYLQNVNYVLCLYLKIVYLSLLKNYNIFIAYL